MEVITSTEIRAFKKEVTGNPPEYFLQVITFFNNSCYCEDGFEPLPQQTNGNDAFEIWLNVKKNTDIDYPAETPVIQTFSLLDIPYDSEFKLEVWMSIEDYNGGEGVLIGEIADEDVKPYRI